MTPRGNGAAAGGRCSPAAGEHQRPASTPPVAVLPAAAADSGSDRCETHRHFLGTAWWTLLARPGRTRRRGGGRAWRPAAGSPPPRPPPWPAAHRHRSAGRARRRGGRRRPRTAGAVGAWRAAHALRRLAGERASLPKPSGYSASTPSVGPTTGNSPIWWVNSFCGHRSSRPGGTTTGCYVACTAPGLIITPSSVTGVRLRVLPSSRGRGTDPVRLQRGTGLTDRTGAATARVLERTRP